MESNKIDLLKLKEYAKEMCVLYVEDDTIIRSEVYSFLKRFFTIVDLANDGKDGLQHYKKRKYDLVISDIEMPNMDGIEMSKAILNEVPNQPIIIMSAYNDSDYLLELINYGIKYYVLKPIDIKLLLKAIYNIAEAKHNETVIHLNNESVIKQNLNLKKNLKDSTNKNSLTGLDNIQSFMHDNSNSIEFTVLVLIDIDNLRYINGLYGVLAGDKVLIAFSELLKIYIQNKSYKIYHFSGDQFILVDRVAYIDTEKYEVEVKNLQEQVEAFSIYLNEADKEVHLDATIGVSIEQEHPLEHAYMALESAKENQKSFIVYNSTLDNTKEMQLKINWQSRIITAMKEDRIIPVFQPIVDNDAKIVKHEALMRLVEIEDGREILFSPVEFLEIALKNKSYSSLSSIMINKVLDSLTMHDSTVSINLSYSDIQNKTFMDTLYKRILREDIGSRLIIEITENENISSYLPLKISINKFRALGSEIAIDDFGSGYANFSHLLEMRPEYVKIDGSIIQDIDTNSHSFILAKAITSFCHELGITVIAEYVHSKEIYDILKTFGVDQYQGFYFSKPLRTITKSEVNTKI